MPPYAEHTPPCSEAPLGEDAPPCQEHTPPCSEAPLHKHSPPTISAPLRADLCRLWSVGFLDAMKGEPVTDDDEIPSDMAEPLVKLAEGCIDGAESFISEVFVENPSTVYQTVYQAGYDVCAAMNAAYSPIEINLN